MAKKRKWYVLTVVNIGLVFIASARMVVMSNIQRLLAGSPSEIAVEDQRTINAKNHEVNQ